MLDEKFGELESQLTSYLKSNPEDIDKVLGIVADEAKAFRKAVYEEHNTKAVVLIYDMLLVYHFTIPKKKLFKADGVVLGVVAKAINYVFPRGYDHDHSHASKELLDEFCEIWYKDRGSWKDWEKTNFPHSQQIYESWIRYKEGNKEK